VSRSLQIPILSDAISQPRDSNALGARTPGMRHASSRITALNIEFVAKPNEAHKVHAAVPAAIQGAFGEVAGFAGSFVMIANHEARLVTIITLWRGEERMQRCNENVRWVMALLTPYMDRCLRVQSSTAYAPCAAQVSQEFEQKCSAQASENELNEEETVWVPRGHVWDDSSSEFMGVSATAECLLDIQPS
jgi:hypothetical protein